MLTYAQAQLWYSEAVRLGPNARWGRNHFNGFYLDRRIWVLEVLLAVLWVSAPGTSLEPY